jgi:hypothetical protein
VIYLLSRLPKVQHYLFLILVSKARLTTAVLGKIEKTLGKFDDNLNKIIYKTTHSNSDFATRIKRNLDQQESEPKKIINTASVIREVQLVWNFLTQVKLSLQLPMMFGHSNSLVHAYLSLNDFASPRFSSSMNPDIDKINSDNSEIVEYRTLIGEKDVG